MITADGDIVHDVVFAHPIARVWAALIDRDAISKWLMVTDFAPEVGRSFTLDARPSGDLWQAKVLAIEPPHRLVWEWTLDGAPTTVTITLQPEGSGTRLHLDHTNLAGETQRNVDLGWPEKFADLDVLLKGNA